MPRFSIKRNPDEYVRPIKCPHCKSTNVRSVKDQRVRERAKEERCHCAAYPFPHRKASLRMCEYHPSVLADVPPSDEEWFDYEAIWETPRGNE